MKIDDSISQQDRQSLCDKVQYVGNPVHKRNPGDFGLIPPSAAKYPKTLCDPTGIFRKEDALKVMQDGIRHGLVSQSYEGEFPRLVWGIHHHGESCFVLEFRLDSVQGTYHGYPLQKMDARYQEVLKKWKN